MPCITLPESDRDSIIQDLVAYQRVGFGSLYERAIEFIRDHGHDPHRVDDDVIIAMVRKARRLFLAR